MFQYLIDTNFQDIKANLQMSLFCIVSSIVSIICGAEIQLSRVSGGGITVVMKIILVISGTIMVLRFFQRVHKPNELVKTMQTKQEQTKFKLIFNNLEDPIIILTKNKIDYVNNAFLNRFSESI